MKVKFLTIFLLNFFLLTETLSAQKKAVLEQVTATNQIKGAPFLILPQTAVKVDFALVEFKYSIGEGLRSLITNINGACRIEDIKKEMKPFETKYGVNLDVLIKLLQRPVANDIDELVITKLDKDFKTSFISVADYSKVFRYSKIKGQLNNNSLSLEYDENGVLTTLKITDEPRLLPTIFSAASAFASVFTAFAKSASTRGMAAAVAGTCVTIKPHITDELDKCLAAYDNFLKNKSVYIDKQFENAKEKFEEDINKEFSRLFYSKEVKITPLKIKYIIPEGENPTGATPKTILLFSYDAVNKKIIIDKGVETNIIYFPQNKFEISVNAQPEQYKLELRNVPLLFDKSQNLISLIGGDPDKKTAVFNIPKSERVRFLKPSGIEAYQDTIVKIPQHGKIGYLSMRLSSLSLTYDTNGELKTLNLEKKSVLDGLFTSGATAAKDVIVALKGDAPKTELEELEDKAKKLELLKKIADLEKETQ